VIRRVKAPAPPAVPFIDHDYRDLARADDTYAVDAAQEFVDVARKIAERKREALKLYEPLPTQAEFHASHTRIRLLRGSNRGGKTMPAAVEVARAVTNSDPHAKYPDRGVVFVVGKDFDHIGQVIYKKLFGRGAFKIIRDQATGRWRTYRPWDPADAARRKAAVDATPLIPKRLIQSIAWKEKKKNIPSKVTLRNGWEIRFFSGIGSPPQGEAVAIIWMDEEIGNEQWFSEMAVRVGDDGDLKFIWSATPQVGTIKFYDLSRAAEETKLAPRRTVEEFVISLADNPHISAQTKADMEANLTEEEKRVRIRGEFSVAGQRIYPEFSLLVHGVPHFEVPADWSHYAVIDPGHQICATLFAAVPPPGLRDPELAGCEVLVYDELYIPACTAATWAEAFARKCEGRTFVDFVIDNRMARQTELGSGLTVYEQYSQAIRRLNVRSLRSGFGFAFGSDMPIPGIEKVRSYLAVQRVHNRPRLRVACNVTDAGVRVKRLRNFQDEIEHYLYRKRGDVVTDTPDEDGKRTHLMACLRYLVMHGPGWVSPTNMAPFLDPAVAAFLKQRRRGGPRTTHFGPPRESVA
jgi:hypothetical protein